tara:strand:- start:43 stop:612 length:570 start_codon:yes stop_codon:yes gene_type:complete
MKNLLVMSLFLVASLDADVDLGEEFAAGDLVTADAFNTKFNALNGVVGEIVDADLLGNWECTSFKDSTDYIDSSHEIENGGNGQVGDGYFYSNTGILSLTETDSESSLNSPKSWSISRDDVINDNGDIAGKYTLLANRIFFYNDEPALSGAFNILMLSDSKLTLNVHGQRGRYPNENIICEIISGSESE